MLAAYTKAKGSMSRVYQQVMTSNPAEDDERFRNILNKAIDDGEVEAFEKYTTESQKSIDARIARDKEEHGEAEDYAKKLGVHDKLFGDAKSKGKNGSKKPAGDEDSLAALIQGRQKGRSNGDFLANLEAKYAPKKKGNKRADPHDEPSEEAFENTAKRARKARSKA